MWNILCRLLDLALCAVDQFINCLFRLGTKDTSKSDSDDLD